MARVLAEVSLLLLGLCTLVTVMVGIPAGWL